MPTLDPRTFRAPSDLAPYVDHTLLAPGASAADLARLCEEARVHRFGAICVRGERVAEARRMLGAAAARVAAVADFPAGEGTTAARIAEACEAVRAGAEEIDLVAPLPALLAGRFEAAFADLRAFVREVHVPVKVILETSRLGRDRSAAAAALARCAGAAFVKTSTGFGGGGATPEDVALLRAVVGEEMGVKASGGVRTAADALAMIRAGADRIGASASVAIVTGRF